LLVVDTSTTTRSLRAISGEAGLEGRLPELYWPDPDGSIVLELVDGRVIRARALIGDGLPVRLEAAGIDDLIGSGRTTVRHQATSSFTATGSL
jgi:hypothetical protein